MTKKNQHELDVELIESIDVDHGLTEWEANFVSDLLGRIRGNAQLVLTDRQRDVALRIQRKLDDSDP